MPDVDGGEPSETKPVGGGDGGGDDGGAAPNTKSATRPRGLAATRIRAGFREPQQPPVQRRCTRAKASQERRKRRASVACGLACCSTMTDSPSSSSSCADSPRKTRRRVSTASTAVSTSSPSLSSSRPSFASRTTKSNSTLNMKALEEWNQTLGTEIKQKDDESASNESESVSIIISHKKRPVVNYASFAKEFSISLAATKRHYSVLKSQPSVAILRVDSIKREVCSTPPLKSPRASPPISSNKRRKLKSKIKQQSISPESAESTKKVPPWNIENYLQTLNGEEKPVRIKEEVLLPSSSNNKSCDGTDSKLDTPHRNLKTPRASKIKQEVSSPLSNPLHYKRALHLRDKLAQPKPPLLQKWDTIVIDSSDDEFEVLSSKKRSKRAEKVKIKEEVLSPSSLKTRTNRNSQAPISSTLPNSQLLQNWGSTVRDSSEDEFQEPKNKKKSKRAVKIKKERLTPEDQQAPSCLKEDSRLENPLSKKKSRILKKTKSINLDSLSDEFQVSKSKKNLKTSPAIKIKEEVLSPSSSQSKSCTKTDSELKNSSTLIKYNRIEIFETDSSDDECQLTQSTNSSETHDALANKQKDLVDNPFSKAKMQKLQNSTKSSLQIDKNCQKEKKSFWKVQFGNESHVKKRKRLIATFKKEIEQSTEPDCPNTTTVDLESSQLCVQNSSEKRNEVFKKRRVAKKKREEVSKAGSVCSFGSCQVSSTDSLTVGYQLFNTTGVRVEQMPEYDSGACSLPLSFGAGPSNEEEENLEKNETENNTNTKRRNLETDELSNSKTSNSKRDSDNDSMDESFLSIDLSISPSKEFSSPTRENYLKSSTPKLDGKRSNSKGKPKIISDNVLPNNTVVLPISQNFSRKKSDSLTNRHSPVKQKVSEIRLQSLYNEDLAEKNITIDMPSDHPKSSDVTHKLNGTTKTVTEKSLVSEDVQTPKLTFEVPKLQGKLNLGNDSSIKEYQLENCVVDNVDEILDYNDVVEEDFESLCKDISKLADGENVTLHRGDPESNVDSSSEKERIQKSSCRKISDSNSLNVSNSMSVPQSREHLFAKKSKALSNGNIPKALVKPQQQQQLQQVSSPKTTNEIPVSSISSLNLPNPVSRDPRLNRSLSPVKSIVSTPSRDPRLNRSSSPIISSVKDSKLLRGRAVSAMKQLPLQSTSQVPETKQPTVETIVDPRLRKRKEREEAEKAAKMQQLSSESVSEQSEIPVNREDLGKGLKRRKSSVFERLGVKKSCPTIKSEKLDLPEFEEPTNFVPNELAHIVKSRRSKSPGKGLGHETDDEDGLSIHASEMFSSDEDEQNSSPRHRKFTSERERERANESIAMKPPISVKNRLGWERISMDSRIPNTTPTTSGSVSTTMQPPRIRLADRLGHIKSNSMMNPITINSRQPLTTAQAQRQPLTTSQAQRQPMQTSQLQNSQTTSRKPVGPVPSPGPVADKSGFFKMNTDQMQKDLENIEEDLTASPYVTFDDPDKTSKYDYISLLELPTKQHTPGLYDGTRTSFFKSYCFKMLRTGKCMIENIGCEYSHKVPFLLKLIQQKTVPLLHPILDFAIKCKFESFLSDAWSIILPILNKDCFEVYEKLYQAEMRDEKFVKELLNYCLASKLCSLESFIKRVSPTITVGDRRTVRIICTAIKDKLQEGFCWETIKCLCQRAVPPKDMVEITIMQCIHRKKNTNHLKEVHDLVWIKMTDEERNKISSNMLQRFKYILEERKIVSNIISVEPNTQPLMSLNLNLSRSDIVSVADNNHSDGVKRTTRVMRQSTESIRSLEDDKSTPTVVRDKKHSPITAPNSSTRQPNHSPLDVLRTSPQRGEITNFKDYTVVEVDPGNKKSEINKWNKKNFWKLYCNVRTINEGLENEDYEYVWQIMDTFSKEKVKDELLKRAYYNILCKEVKSSERHVSEIIKQAARKSTLRFNKIMFDVGIWALIDLANNDLWVMALQLLSWVKTIQPKEPKTALVLISAEIYLANNDPLEALYTLQTTRVIRTNRDEWLVKDSTKDDEKHRNKIVFILLKALSYNDPEKAVYLFTALMQDQYDSYFPIDLPTYLDQLTLLLIIQDKDELVSDICRLVMNKDLTFKKSTYQEVISRMLPLDEVLANQILEYAIYLGYYNDIEIKSGYTTLIVDTNYLEEELYLMLKRLVRKLTLNVGPVVYRLKPNQLKVILIFEDIPSEKRLYRDEFHVMTRDRYKDIRNMVNRILATRFTPPIRIGSGKVEKYSRIVSRTLVEYLKHWN